MNSLEYLNELSKELNISKNTLVKYIAVVGTNKENIREYALNVNCAICRKQNGFIVDYVACMINDKDRKINEIQSQLALTEKALELACERVKYFEEMQDKEMGFSEFFGYDSDYDLQAIIEQYKEQAKEMMKSE